MPPAWLPATSRRLGEYDRSLAAYEKALALSPDYPEAIEYRAEAYLARRGGIAVFLSRFLPVLHSVIPLTVGMSPMRYRTFMAWTAPACVIWAFAYVSVGSLAAGSYRELSQDLHWAGFVFVAIIAVFIVAVFVVKTVLQKREAAHMEAAARSPEPPHAEQ